MTEKRDMNAPWRQRELELFIGRKYAPLPWGGAEFWLASDPKLHHFAHVSTADPSKLAYTPNDRFGEEDRQLRVKPGKYLRKFFPQLTATEVQTWCGKFAAENEKPDVHFAHDPEDIAEIYHSGPSSCMSGFDTGEHPARIYGAGDLAIAYLGNLDGATARCLCWPEKLVFGRIYGDTYRLSAGLDALGYNSTDGEAFEGARMLRIPCGGGFVGPYLDGPIGVNDNGKNLIISTNYGITADSTNGTIGDGTTCDRCEDVVSRDDAQSVQDATWCNSCAECYSFFCEDCEETCSDEDGKCTKDSTVCSSCCESNYTRCDRVHCGEYEIDGDIVTVDGEEWCKECADDHAKRCDSCEGYFPSDDIVDVRGESHDIEMCKECAEDSTFICRECPSSADTWHNRDKQEVCNMDLCPECAYDRQKAADDFQLLAEGWLPPPALGVGRLSLKTRIRAKLASLPAMVSHGPERIQFRPRIVARYFYGYAPERFASAPPALPSGPIFVGSGVATCERPAALAPVVGAPELDSICAHRAPSENMADCAGSLRAEVDGRTRCAVHAHVKTCEYAPIGNCDGEAVYRENGRPGEYRCARHLYSCAA